MKASKITIDLREEPQHKIKKGMWRNITGRRQVVEVVGYTSTIVDYVWKECPIRKFEYTKSLEHFLRSYSPVN